MERWIGVDVGATSAKAHLIECTPEGLRATERAHEEVHRIDPAFRPVPLQEQLDQLRAGKLERGPAERRAAQAWVTAIVRACTRVARGAELPLALCAPGQKTASGAGLGVVRNGPRHPRLLAELELALGPACRATTLWSDALAATLGEHEAAGGALRAVHVGYFIGVGTGLAEGLLYAGEAQPLPEQCEPAWRSGAEEHLAFGGLARRYEAGAAAPARAPVALLAARGDARARELLRALSAELGRFVAGRVHVLEQLRTEPPARVVVGQRMGELLLQPELAAWVRDPFEEALAASHAATPYVASGLRAAGALGAVAFERRKLA